ncbi:uncharacterized protein [Dermacentor albipictus]|uniref:uncharacterized protein isoform X5 n=1 Tax=Dermacentor albipictus TaxID=60249 RepID=UPI0038FCFEB0
MHALLATYLALYSVGAGATTPPPVGGYHSSDSVIDAASTCLDNEHGADTEHFRYQVRSFTDCLTEALGDKTNKEHEAGAKHFAEKITLCMRQKLTQVRARAYFELLTTVLAGHGNSEHKTEMPFDMPLMMTTSGRTL